MALGSNLVIFLFFISFYYIEFILDIRLVRVIDTICNKLFINKHDVLHKITLSYAFSMFKCVLLNGVVLLYSVDQHLKLSCTTRF
jgi:hypothetical protein